LKGRGFSGADAGFHRKRKAQPFVLNHLPIKTKSAKSQKTKDFAKAIPHSVYHPNRENHNML
jgi:hypothetical protein